MATRHIVVGLDGSPGSDAAARWCVEAAPLLDADIVAVHAILPLLSMVPATAPTVAPLDYDEVARREFARELDHWCEPFESAGIEFRALVLAGEPTEMLMKVADESDAAMIVVGRRGRGGFKELVLGSVPHRLSHHATRPVVVVPT
jgi:nucleotide-binding universal stress UspA family protein